MANLNIKPIKVKVADFNTREQSVTCILNFKGVSDKEEYDFSESITWKTKFENLELEAHMITVEVKKKTKNRFREIELEMPHITFDENFLQKALISFFEQVRHKAEQVFVKTNSEGYIELIDMLKQTETLF
jgi:hypothetical protein